VDEALKVSGLPILPITAAKGYVPQELFKKIAEKLTPPAMPNLCYRVGRGAVNLNAVVSGE
jgi:hypothetical protein